VKYTSVNVTVYSVVVAVLDESASIFMVLVLMTENAAFIG